MVTPGHIINNSQKPVKFTHGSNRHKFPYIDTMIQLDTD
jgi:hypothetical protein